MLGDSADQHYYYVQCVGVELIDIGWRLQCFKQQLTEDLCDSMEEDDIMALALDAVIAFQQAAGSEFLARVTRPPKGSQR